MENEINIFQVQPTLTYDELVALFKEQSETKKATTVSLIAENGEWRLCAGPFRATIYGADTNMSAARVKRSHFKIKKKFIRIVS